MIGYFKKKGGQLKRKCTLITTTRSDEFIIETEMNRIELTDCELFINASMMITGRNLRTNKEETYFFSPFREHL